MAKAIVRYSIDVWLDDDGGGALTGAAALSALPATLANAFYAKMLTSQGNVGAVIGDESNGIRLVDMAEKAPEVRMLTA
jgi:hypothetical protein